MKVNISANFEAKMSLLSRENHIKIAQFIYHVERYGLNGLKGRNKSSAPSNPHTKRERANFAYAQKYCLWHYHIGIPCYVGDDGDMTSEYILHYQRFDEEIRIIAMLAHPPFNLPNEQTLQ